MAITKEIESMKAARDEKTAAISNAENAKQQVLFHFCQQELIFFLTANLLELLKGVTPIL